jgi:hypothetical protein
LEFAEETAKNEIHKVFSGYKDMDSFDISMIKHFLPEGYESFDSKRLFARKIEVKALVKALELKEIHERNPLLVKDNLEYLLSES